MDDLWEYKSLLQEFFRDCKNKNLLNCKINDMQKFNSDCIRSEIHLLANSAFIKIQNDKPYHQKFADEEYDSLQFYFNLSWIRENIEATKTYLDFIFDPSKIKLDKGLGGCLTDICKKIREGENDYSAKIKDAFQVYFRNALSHNAYVYGCENGVKHIIWYDNKKKGHRMGITELEESLNKIICARAIMMDVCQNFKVGIAGKRQACLETRP